MQAGGLILSVKVDGNDPLDIPCTVDIDGGEIRDIHFDYNDVRIFYVFNSGSIENGIFDIRNAGEHTHQYQVVGVKLPQNVVSSTNPILPLQPTGLTGSIEVTFNKPISDSDLVKLKVIIDNILNTAEVGSTWTWGNYISTNHVSGEVSTIVLNYNGSINEISGIFLYD